MGPNLDQLLKSYWYCQKIVPKTGNFIRKEFQMGRGLMQGDPTYLAIFNIVVDAVMQAVLDVVYGPQEAQHGLGWAAGERNMIFYTDDGRIAGWDHMWVQDEMSVTVAMFHIMGLETNLDNTKAMVCTPGFIWGEWGEKAYKRRATGEGETFLERKRLRVSCTKCGVTATQSYLKQNMASLYVICSPQTRGFNEKG